jgi:hypothetical protein
MVLFTYVVVVVWLHCAYGKYALQRCRLAARLWGLARGGEVKFAEGGNMENAYGKYALRRCRLATRLLGLGAGW